jgi:hypothetical protein
MLIPGRKVFIFPKKTRDSFLLWINGPNQGRHEEELGMVTVHLISLRLASFKERADVRINDDLLRLEPVFFLQ